VHCNENLFLECDAIEFVENCSNRMYAFDCTRFTSMCKQLSEFDDDSFRKSFDEFEFDEDNE
jgi:hypothetical protein